MFRSNDLTDTITLSVNEFIGLPSSQAKTVYVVVVVGLAIGFAIDELLNVSGDDQLYESGFISPVVYFAIFPDPPHAYPTLADGKQSEVILDVILLASSNQVTPPSKVFIKILPLP
jgi:hypothetical protein